MFNLTTFNHFLLVAWPCLLYINFNLPYNCITHITLYTQSKRLLLAVIHCSLYTSGSQTGTRRDLLFVFLLKKYIHSCSFYLSGSVTKFLKFCVVYFPRCFLKMAIKISHSHFVHVALCQFWFSRLLIE